MYKNRNGKPVSIEKMMRRIVQIVTFVFLPSLFILIFQSLKSIILSIFYQTETWLSLFPEITLLFVVSLVTIFAGRFFCGWMCAFGSMGDLIYGLRSKFFGKANRISKKLDNNLRIIKYVILFGSVIFIWGLQIIQIPLGVNPWDLFGMLLSINNFPSFQLLIGSWMVACILLFAIMIGSFFVERFFCRYLCPLGAYFSLISRIRLFHIRKPREQCNGCSICTKNCVMGIDLNEMDKVTSGECIDCMECEIHCPKDNAKFSVGKSAKKSIIVGMIACILLVGAFFLSTFFEKHPINSNIENEDQIEETIEVEETEEPEVVEELEVVEEPEVVEVLEETKSPWSDGVYEGSGLGFRGYITLFVEISDGWIEDIQIISEQEDKKFLNSATSKIFSDIISSQDANVDAVSGATYSSNGIIDAVKMALQEAQK